MNFKFDRQGIAKYNKLLQKRIHKVREKEIEILLNELYTLSPKVTGRLASNYYCTVNTNIVPYDENKFTPTFEIPKFTLNDQVYVVNGCPYLQYVNFGTISILPQNFVERAISNSKYKLQSYLKEIGQMD